jgi:hypothetical protein
MKELTLLPSTCKSARLEGPQLSATALSSSMAFKDIPTTRGRHHRRRPKAEQKSRHLLIPSSLVRKRSRSLSKGTRESAQDFWPRDFLSSDLPKTRILTWGYDSHVSKFFGGAADQSNLFGHAKNLLYTFAGLRRECVCLTSSSKWVSS